MTSSHCPPAWSLCNGHFSLPPPWSLSNAQSSPCMIFKQCLALTVPFVIFKQFSVLFVLNSQKSPVSKLKGEIWWWVKKCTQLNSDFILSLNPLAELSFLDFFRIKETFISKKPVHTGHLSVTKGKQRLSNIMGIGVINSKSDLLLIQLNHYILVFHWFFLPTENHATNVLNVHV